MIFMLLYISFPLRCTNCCAILAYVNYAIFHQWYQSQVADLKSRFNYTCGCIIELQALRVVPFLFYFCDEKGIRWLALARVMYYNRAQLLP